jgi:uncharacterized membrane protein
MQSGETPDEVCRQILKLTPHIDTICLLNVFLLNLFPTITRYVRGTAFSTEQGKIKCIYVIVLSMSPKKTKVHPDDSATALSQN